MIHRMLSCTFIQPGYRLRKDCPWSGNWWASISSSPTASHRPNWYPCKGVNLSLRSLAITFSWVFIECNFQCFKKFNVLFLNFQSVGTDRNIQDWILERRANTLESILKFFHCDFETISTSFNADRNKFTEKLYQMFETYLPILQYSANLFSNIPILKLPKVSCSW